MVIDEFWTHKKLKSNQYLVKEEDLYKWEFYLDDALLGDNCIGFTNGERDKSLDGEYCNLEKYYPIVCANCERMFNGWSIRTCPYCGI